MLLVLRHPGSLDKIMQAIDSNNGDVILPGEV